jgi:hypothetical protein
LGDTFPLIQVSDRGRWTGDMATRTAFGSNNTAISDATRCDAMRSKHAIRQACCLLLLRPSDSLVVVAHPPVGDEMVGRAERPPRPSWVGLRGQCLQAQHWEGGSPPGSFPTTVMTRCWHTQERQGKPQALRHAPLAAGTRWPTDMKGTQEGAQKGRRDAIERRRDTALVARLDEPLEG